MVVRGVGGGNNDDGNQKPDTSAQENRADAIELEEPLNGVGDGFAVHFVQYNSLESGRILPTVPKQHATVAELADARDSKSRSP